MKSMLKLSVLSLFWLVEFSGVMYAQLPTPAAPAPPAPIAVPIAVPMPVVVSLTTAEKIAKVNADLANLKTQREAAFNECTKLEAAVKVAEKTAQDADTAAKDPQLQANLAAADKEANEKDMQNVPRPEQRAAEKKVDQAEAAIEKKEQEAKDAAKALLALQDALKKAEVCLDNLDECIDRQLAELPKLEATLRSEMQHKEVLERLEGLKGDIKNELMTELASVKTAVSDGTSKVTDRIGVAEKRTEAGLETLATVVDNSATKVTEKIDGSSSTVNAAIASSQSAIQKDLNAVNTNVMGVDAKVVGIQKQMVTLGEEIADTKEIARAFSPELQTAINDLKGQKLSNVQDPEESGDLTAKVKELEEKLTPAPGLASVPAPPVEKAPAVVTMPQNVIQSNVVYGSQPIVQQQCQPYWNGYQWVRSNCSQQTQMTYSNNVVRSAPVQWNGFRRQ